MNVPSSSKDKKSFTDFQLRELKKGTIFNSSVVSSEFDGSLSFEAFIDFQTEGSNSWTGHNLKSTSSIVFRCSARSPMAPSPSKTSSTCTAPSQSRPLATSRPPSPSRSTTSTMTVSSVSFIFCVRACILGKWRVISKPAMMDIGVYFFLPMPMHRSMRCQSDIS